MIRYYKMICLDFTNHHYYCQDGDNLNCVGDNGRISSWGNYKIGQNGYPEIKDFIPDAEPIERMYINATDRPSLEGFKYVEPWS